MRDNKTGQDWAGQRRRRIFHFDGPLLVFLAVGWSLIFATATLGLQRTTQQWLPVRLLSQASADYSVDASQTSKLAPVRPQIVEAVKQDAKVVRVSTPTIAVAMIGATPTPTFRPTTTLSPSALTVSAGGPYTGKEGSPVSLIARGPSLAPETLVYRWDLDNDGLYDDAEGASASVVFYDEGKYTIGVQVADPSGRVATDSTTVSVSNVAPTVRTEGNRYVNEGEEIRFSATASDPGYDILFYTWEFGDGTGATATLSPRHTYLDNGNYIVRLRVEDNDGGVTEAFCRVYVANLPPIVNAGPDQVVNEGDSVTFSGIATDPGVLDTLTYAWDFNYDGLTFNADASGPTVSTVYPDGPAAIVAALRVQDKDSAPTIDTVNVTVNNVAPTIVGVTNNGPVGEGAPLTLVVSATDVGNDTLTYAFDWENDGAFDAVNQPATVAHTWYNQGNYTVGIRADDGDGGQAFTTTVVSAYNVPPIAVAGSPIVRLEGSPITFDGSGSSDPGIYDPLTYQWSFGDGSPAVNGITTTHIYADNNVYSVTLTVTDDSGAADSDLVTANILNANPIADAGPDRTVDEEVPLDFAGTASDPGAGDTLTYAWDFGDGTGATGTLSPHHTYPDNGNYVVTLRVRDDDYPYPTGGGGEIGEAIDTLRVTVNNVPPTNVEAGGPYTGHTGQIIVLSGTAVDVPADILTYEWDLDGDGSYDLTGQTVAATWAMTGVYTVTLRVTDDDGGAGFDTARVTIGNQPPTAEAGGPYTGDEGIPIVLTGTGADPDTDPLTYTWDLDYDTIFETPGQVVTNTWPDNGVYTVTLRVDDGWGGIATDDAVVTVNNVFPIADAGGPYTTTAGIPVTLTGSGADVPADTLTYAWDLNNDGAFDDGALPDVTYVWATPGIYTVTLQVDDGDSGIATDETTVDVR